MFEYLAAPGWGQSSCQIELLVDRDVVLAAVRLVVVHEEEDIRGLDEFALVVVPLDRALQPAKELHTAWVIRHQRVREAGGFVDKRSGCRHPVVLEITCAALEAHHDHGAAVLVRTDHTRGFDPQHVHEDVVPGVEGEVTNRRIRPERYPGTLLFRGTHEGPRYAVALHHVPVELGDVDDFVRRGWRRGHALVAGGRRLLS